jgi:hypothetical protein
MSKKREEEKVKSVKLQVNTTHHGQRHNFSKGGEPEKRTPKLFKAIFI